MNEQKIEKDLKDKAKIGRGVANKVVLGAVAAGAVYLLGAKKGMKIGHARGYLDGYTKATQDIADLIRNGASAFKAD
jgi:hypothetical protein